jgi:hypothetical protein
MIPITIRSIHITTPAPRSSHQGRLASLAGGENRGDALHWRGRTVLLLLAFAALVVPAVAKPDAIYHSQHYQLNPVGNAPLDSGFVENIHPNGPNIFGHEQYHLNGALPSTTLQITLEFFPFDPSCSGTPIDIATANVVTNVAGNGNADAIFTRSAVPTFLAGASHGQIWTFKTPDGAVAYETDCVSVQFD